MEINIDGHSAEYRVSPSGSLDPWTSDYANSLGVGIMCTADMAGFILIDGEHIYKLKNGIFSVVLSNEKFNSWDSFNEWLLENKERYFGTLSQSKSDVDEMKKANEKIKSMTESERKEYFREEREKRRKRREEQIKKMKDTEK